MTTTTNEEYINKMYDASLASEKAQLETDYEANKSDLEAEQQAAQKTAQQNLVNTYVEAAKAQKNYNEVQNAYGLTSGAMAQARLAQDNQLQADMTAIRTAQQQVDAEIERQRSILAQEFAAAISKAQSENDLARAQALYEEAQAAEENLRQKQKEAAALMASAGDYSLYQTLYGLTDAQAATLKAAYDAQTAASSSGSGSGSSSGSGAEIDAADKAILDNYSGGVVTDANIWKMMAATYGEALLKAKGYSYRAASGSPGPTGSSGSTGSTGTSAAAKTSQISVTKGTSGSTATTKNGKDIAGLLLLE